MSHKPAHLLLVDDDPGLLKLLGLRLTSEGYSVVTAESGAEGLRVLNREKVDLVISDLRMDEMGTVCSCLLKSRKCSRECRWYDLLRMVLFPMPLLQHSRAFLVSSPSLSIKMRYIRQSTMRWSNPRQPPMNAGARQSSPAARRCCVCWNRRGWWRNQTSAF